MQDEHKKFDAELEHLKQKLAATEAERDRIDKELLALKSRPVAVASRRRATTAAVSVLAIASVLSTVTFHDAQSNMQRSDAPALNAFDAVGDELNESQAPPPAAENKPAPRASKTKPRAARSKPASRKQWGPSLVMSVPETIQPGVAFDPVVKAQQKNLLTLGFDLGKADGVKGARTRQAIAEFRALYLPDSARHLRDAELAIIMENYASVARRDAARFGIDHGVVAAIRFSSVRTGVDFSYLMKLAAAESNFEPDSESTASSATGIYQFTRDTWLNTLKKHGEKYGLVGDYAAQIEYFVTRGGYQRPMVRDKAVYQHLLALRKNPRLSAMMAAESVRDSQKKLAYTIDREPTETDLYLTHFLGAHGAITFLRSLEQSPGAYAVDIFPQAAGSNRDVFHPRKCDPRTVDEVYTLFGEKFSTSRYDDLAAN